MRYRFQFRRYRLPFRAAVRTAHGIWTEREGVIVRLADASEGAAENAVGYGEAAPVRGFGLESADEVEAACREIGEWVEGERLVKASTRLPCLRNAVGAAIVEVGRVCDPLYGPSSRTPARVESMAIAESAKGRVENPPYLGVAALLPAGKAAIAQIGPKADAGFRVFKWKVGVGDVADELSLLDDVCAELPSGAKLRLDANGAWDRRKAERWLERCAERPVEFVEQPCFAEASAFAKATADRSSGAARKEMDLLLGLAGDFPTKIALDESLVSDGDVERWVGAGWPGVFVVKPSLFGDVAGVMARLEKAKADVVFSSALETAVGARNALRVAWAWAGKVEGAASSAPKHGGDSTPPPNQAPAERPLRALGFGVWPLFQDGRFDGPHAVPFFRAEDVEKIDVERVWNALGEK